MNWDAFQVGRLHSLRFWDSWPILIARYLFMTLGAFAALALLSSFFIPITSYLLTYAFLLLSPGLLFWSLSLYYRYLKNHPDYLVTKERRAQNPLNNFDFGVLAHLETLAKTSSWKAFWQTLADNHDAAEILYRLGLTVKEMSAVLPEKAEAAEIEALAAQANRLAGDRYVTTYHLLMALFELPPVQQFLASEQVSEDEIAVMLDYHQSRHEASRINAPSRTGGFAKTWAVSYTTLLDALTEVLPASINRRVAHLPLFGREKLIDQLVAELNKASGKNLLLVGEPGVGKKEVFYHLASRIINYQTKTNLDGKDVRILDVQRLLAAADSKTGLQQLTDQLLSEIVRAGTIVLFIDQIDLLLSPNDKIGSTDLGNLLQSYLESNKVYLIGTTSSENYLELIKPSRYLSQNFTKIDIPAPNQTDRLGILLSHIYQFENRYQVFFLLPSLSSIVSLAERYLKDAASPERELRLAEDVASTTHAAGGHLITTTEVTQVVERQAQVPIQVQETEKSTLLNLEAELHKRIVGQNFAIKQVSDALLRARAGLSSGQKPIGSFMFLGPTGVGKTETAKALAEIYFGSEQKLIRLDMSEFADQNALEKLLGLDPVNKPGALTLAVQKSPSAVLLLDEIEKSNAQVKNAFLQLLDEGRITTNYGKVLDFTNTIVIATSNAGSDLIRNQIQSGQPVEAFSNQLVDQLIKYGTFLTEFLNRFDGVIVFAPLNQNEVAQIVTLQIESLATRLKKDKGIELIVAPTVLQQISARGYDPVFGARALQRVINNELETAIARQIIVDSPKPGSKLTISVL